MKALVSYPGYDNNRLANTVDAEYFARLQTDESRPMYNHATQERTAPGSTFKMVTATAGLSEGIITPNTKINSLGKFKLVDNEPECWIYPGSRHGMIDVTNAIRVSCNYFFYQVGYDLSLVGNTYSDPTGIRKITDYASSTALEIRPALKYRKTNRKSQISSRSWLRLGRATITLQRCIWHAM